MKLDRIEKETKARAAMDVAELAALLTRMGSPEERPFVLAWFRNTELRAVMIRLERFISRALQQTEEPD